MNQPPDSAPQQSPSSTREDLQDRLTDQSLEEVSGRQTPPDVAREVVGKMSPSQIAPSKDNSRKTIWRNWAIAAFVLVLLAGVTLQWIAPPFGKAISLTSLSGVPAEEKWAAPARSENIDRQQFWRSQTESAPAEPFSTGFQSITKLQPEAARPGLGGDAVNPAGRTSALKNNAGTQAGPPTLALPGSMPTDPSADFVPPRRRGPLPLEEEETQFSDSPAEGLGGEDFQQIFENPFRLPTRDPLSTFSIDVDTASYAVTRRYLSQNNRLPPPDAVRIEEFVNYFPYNYDPPADQQEGQGERSAPFAARLEVASCPWNTQHRLVRVALKGREIAHDQRPSSNLVFLIDVSGSMRAANKLPLLKQAFRMLVEQLTQNDRVAIAVYAGAAGLVLDSTPGDQKDTINEALGRLNAGGSTNGGAGIELAYATAGKHFIKGGVNRVILATDGDFNVGTTSYGALQQLIRRKARSGVFLSVLGFGQGNLKDNTMETLADKGNGNYGYIDTLLEARKLLVQQLSGTLITIAKDVKIQVEFNPSQVKAYRLLGYENRLLAAEDFHDDTKDAGEIGAGHTVTAFYEVIPAKSDEKIPGIDGLKYQKPLADAQAPQSNELLTLKLKYKKPDAKKSEDALEFPLVDAGNSFDKASEDFQFAAAVVEFGLLLRNSQHKGQANYEAVKEIAAGNLGADNSGYRQEFLELVKKAQRLSGQP